MIIIVFGLPGSGKSFFASRLAEELGAVYLNSDRLRMEMYSERLYTEKEKRSVYQAMCRRAEEAARQQRDVVLDGTFYKQELRLTMVASLQDVAPICFIEIRAAEAVAIERLNKPRRYSEAGPDVYYKLKSQWEPRQTRHLILDSSKCSVDEMLSEAMAHLAEHV